MLVKYGKTVDMRNIDRNIEAISGIVSKVRACMEENYSELGGVQPGCRICGSGQGTLFVKLLGKYNYYQCDQCGALFLGKSPDVQRMYCGEDTVNSDSYIDDAVYERRVEMISAPKIQFVLETCQAEGNIHIGSWLDIGCGGGEILSWLSHNSDISAEGIESDEKEFRYTISKGLHVENCYIDLEHENKKINQIIGRNDVVSLLNVLEHMEEPTRFIQYVYDHMHDNAILVFEVPRHPSVASFANLTCCNVVYRHIASLGHLQVFSEKSIGMMLQNRFQIIGKWEFGQGYTDLINNAMIMAGKVESDLYDSLISLSNKIQPVFDAEGLADQILVVAKKI